MSATFIDPATQAASAPRNRVLTALREAYLREAEVARPQPFDCVHEALLAALDGALGIAASLHDLAVKGR